VMLDQAPETLCACHQGTVFLPLDWYTANALRCKSLLAQQTRTSS
jgi:hypothetical protein